jgi:hypothetical protein
MFSGTLSNADIINQATSGLTDISQIAAQILAGNAYVNIHDPVYPGGEIRGQLVPVSAPSSPEPTGLTLVMVGASTLLGVGRIRLRRTDGARPSLR